MGFIWRRYPSGFISAKWKSGMSYSVDHSGFRDGEPVLLATGNCDDFEPFEREPNLHLRFAAIDPNDADAMRRFANEYGPLGIGEPWQDEVNLVRPAERVRDWKKQIENMSLAVRVYQFWKNENKKELEQFFPIQYLGNVFGYSMPAIRDVPPIYAAQPWPSRTKTEWQDVRVRAAEFLAEAVNDGMAKGMVTHRIVPERNGFKAEVPAQTILGEMWKRLSGNLTGNHDFRVCEVCGKLYAVDPNDGRTRKRLYCNQNCAVNASRRRAEEINSVTKKKGASRGKITPSPR